MATGWMARGQGCSPLVAFRSDESSPQTLGLALAQLGFDLPSPEGVEEVIGEEGHQGKGLDGLGMLLRDVVGVPGADRLIKAVVLDK